MSRKVIIKRADQIDAIREAGKYLTELLWLIGHAAKPGVVLNELEAQAQRFMDMNNLKGAFKGYHWFPANLCLSINDCVVHGIPDETVLQEWDLLKIDAGVVYNECIADSAVSLIVGWADKNPEGQALIDATKDSLDQSLIHIAPGKSLYDFGVSVDTIMRDRWYSIIKTLTWHGVWVEVHEAPSIYNRWYKPLKKQTFQKDMVIALEPITAIKSKEFSEWTNGWNLYTDRGDLGAQWEYTLAVTENGYEILAWHTTNPFI